MAKTLESFKNEYKGLEAKATDYVHTLHMFQTSNTSAESFIGQGAVEVGLRVQALKDRGATGKKIDDFIRDPEVKTAVAELRNLAAQRESELRKMLQLKAKAEELIRSANKFYQTLADEIAGRKKQLTTKLHIGNKSLKGMYEELEKMRKTYEKQGMFGQLAESIATLQVAGYFESYCDDQIDYALSKTKDAAISSNQRAMLEQSMNERHVKTVLGTVKALAQEFAAAAKLAKAAKQANKASDLKRFKADAASAAKKLIAAVAPLETAINDGWVAEQLRNQKAKALTVVPQMFPIRDAVAKESKVIAAL